MNKELKIITTPYDGNGGPWFRQKQWVNYFREHKLAYVSVLPAKISPQATIELIRQHDVLFCRFISTEVRGLVEQVRREAPEVKIVTDDDDDIYHVSPMNESYKDWGLDEVRLEDGTMLWTHGQNGFDKYRNRRQLVDYEAVMELSDVVTTTTKRLNASLERHNDVVAIIPNSVDPAYYPDLPSLRQGKTTKLLWAGSASHFEDLMLAKPALKAILEERPDVELHTVGTTFEGFTKDMPENRVIHHPWVPVEGHGFHMATIGAHIGLCPLVDNDFNRMKSSLKFYEYSALGLATVASKTAPYTDDIIDGRSGVLADPQHFKEAVLDLVDDPIKRATIAAEGQRYVSLHRNLDTVAQTWLELFQGLTSS